MARSLWYFYILHLPPPQHSLTGFHFLSLCQCLVSSMILVLIIISLSLSALKSRANDGVSKTCVLSCVQQGATPLGVTAQKPVRRERASCSVKLFPGEFLVSGCILSLTEKSIKFILWISAHQRQQGGLFGGIYCLCKDTQEPPLTPHSFVPNVQTTSVDCLRPPSHWRQTAGLSPLLWIQPWRPQVLCCVLLLPALCLL